MKISAAHDTLAHIIKRKLGNPVAKNKATTMTKNGTASVRPVLAQSGHQFLVVRYCTTDWNDVSPAGIF